MAFRVSNAIIAYGDLAPNPSFHTGGVLASICAGHSVRVQCLAPVTGFATKPGPSLLSYIKPSMAQAPDSRFPVTGGAAALCVAI